MNKKTKMVLGVAALGVVAYYLWKKSKTAEFANQIGVFPTITGANAPQMCDGYRKQCPDGKVYCVHPDQGYQCPKNTNSSLTKNQLMQQGRISGN